MPHVLLMLQYQNSKYLSSTELTNKHKLFRNNDFLKCYQSPSHVRHMKRNSSLVTVARLHMQDINPGTPTH